MKTNQPKPNGASTVNVRCLLAIYRSSISILFLPLLLLLLALPGVVQAEDYTYTTSGGTITITGYTGPGGDVTIPDAINGLPVTSIGDDAFRTCTSLTNFTIPNSVTTIGDEAFKGCSSLTGVYFRGNAPSVASDAFDNDNNATVYYLPGTTGWETTFGGRPTAPWVLPYPLILTSGPSLGVQTNGFGFIISWATNTPVVVEACTDLASPLWSPVGTNTLTDGSSYFSDPEWTNDPGRFYRLRSP